MSATQVHLEAEIVETPLAWCEGRFLSDDYLNNVTASVRNALAVNGVLVDSATMIKYRCCAWDS